MSFVLDYLTGFLSEKADPDTQGIYGCGPIDIIKHTTLHNDFGLNYKIY